MDLRDDVRTLSQEVGGPAPDMGSAELRVNSLTVTGNQFSRLPLRPAPQVVVGTAPLRITDNPNLCEGAVQAFVDSQPPAVRVGAVLTGNRPGCW